MTQAIAWISWGLLALTILGAFWFWLRRRGELVAPLPICLGVIGLYVLPRAAYLLWFGRAPLTSGALTLNDQTALIGETVALSTAGVLAFVAGHGARSAKAVAQRLRFTLPNPDPVRAIWIAGGLGAIGVLALALLLHAGGGLVYALGHQVELGFRLQGKQPLFQLARLLMVPTALLLVDPVRGRTRSWVWVAAFATALALFPLGRRSFLVLAIAYPIVLYHLTIRPIRVARMLFGLLALGTLLFSYNFIRLLGPERLVRAVQVFLRQPQAAVHFAFSATGELKIFDAATIVVRDVPQELPLNHGVTFVRVPWMIIPRRIWTDKPVTLGEVIVSRYLPELGRTGYPPMAIGELYAAGGPFAVVLGFFGLGWFGRIGWEWRQHRRGVGDATLYLAFCFFIFDFTRVGDPSRTIWFSLIGGVFFTVAFCISARPSHLLARHSS
ncbi:MAG: hypothetical protein Q8R92_08400 [Deltaproteobacteria bacterium]|nr:hypothetical protein [Deltaproteobacteria bacterium]